MYKKKIDCLGAKFILGRKGIKINQYTLSDIGIKQKLIGHFTIKNNTISGYIKTSSNHITDKKFNIIFPRFGFIQYAEKYLKNYIIINKIPTGILPEIPFKWKCEYTNNQKLIAEHILENFYNELNVKNGKSGLILNLKAGQGKTFLALGLVEKIQRKTLIVCHNKTIMYQWIKIINDVYPKNKVAQFYGVEKSDGDIVVGIINSLVIQKSNFFKDYGFVILDEVHEYSSKTRKRIYNLAQSVFMIGLSATPDERTDNLDKVNVWHCGNILNAESISGYNEKNINFTGNVEMYKYIGPNEYTEIITNPKLEIICFTKMVNQLCMDPYRIHLIVKIAYELRSEKKYVLIFADRKDYLDRIQKELNKFHINSNILNDVGIDSQKVVGGSTASEIERAERYATVILSTYQFFGTGKSIPKLDSVILATPRKKKSKQFIGRIFRIGGDDSITRRIIDIVDWGTPLKNSWYTRKKYYNESKFPIRETTINYEILKEDLDIYNKTCEYMANDSDVLLNELETMFEKNKVVNI